MRQRQPLSSGVEIATTFIAGSPIETVWSQGPVYRVARDIGTGRRLAGLRFGLRKLLGTRIRNARVRRLVSSRIRPTACFDELPLFPRLDLLELCEFSGAFGCCMNLATQ